MPIGTPWRESPSVMRNFSFVARTFSGRIRFRDRSDDQAYAGGGPIAPAELWTDPGNQDASLLNDRPDHGDCQKQFVQLAQQHLDSLYRTALRMTNDHALAEDIVQETCLKAYANFARYSPETNFKAWLFRILTNLCIDHLRRSAKIPMVPIEAAPEDSESFPSSDRSTDSPETQAMRGDTQRALIDALSTLAPEPRAVVVMILIEGMSYDEAAESLDLPLNTIRSKLHRARKKLQERLSLLPEREPGDCRKTDDSPRVLSLF